MEYGLHCQIGMAAMSVRNQIKNLSTRYGGYRILRWVQDHVVDRSRLDESAERRRFYGRLISPDDLCFDVGSNIGDVSSVLLALGARVVAVDPQPAAMRELKARLGRHRNLTCVEAGLSDKPGELDLYLHDQVGTTSMVPDWGAGKTTGKITVPVTTLDGLIKRFGCPKYCKIDVEGFELNVLEGLNERIGLLSLEFHADERNMTMTRLCLDRLEKQGRLQVNVIPFSSYAFAWPKWVTRDEFETKFWTELSNNPEFAYGDIFIRYRECEQHAPSGQRYH
jgi:FkbM family methyltransferase